MTNDKRPSSTPLDPGQAYLDQTELTRRLRRVLSRIEDLNVVPLVMGPRSRDLVRDFCRDIEPMIDLGQRRKGSYRQEGEQ